MTVATTSSSTAFALGEIRKLEDGLRALAEPDRIATLTGIADAVASSLRAGGRIFFCGNGGSAADAQHLAAELIGRQNYNRAPLAGIALTVDTSALTALGNDYGYDTVFARQIEALGRPGDVLFGISTSGRSRNVVRAVERAKELDITTVAFTGDGVGDLGDVDWLFAAPASETAKIQELHITGGHIVFALVERMMFPAENPGS